MAQTKSKLPQEMAYLACQGEKIATLEMPSQASQKLFSSCHNTFSALKCLKKCHCLRSLLAAPEMWQSQAPNTHQYLRSSVMSNGTMAYVVHVITIVQYVVLHNYHLFISFYIITLNGASLVCSIAASETLFAGIACAIILAGAPIFEKLCHS